MRGGGKGERAVGLEQWRKALGAALPLPWDTVGRNTGVARMALGLCEIIRETSPSSWAYAHCHTRFRRLATYSVSNLPATFSELE